MYMYTPQKYILHLLQILCICRATVSGLVVQLVMVTRLAGDIKQLSTKNQPISNWAVTLLSTFFNTVHQPIFFYM